MRIIKFIVKDFKMIDHVELSDLSNINAIVAPNGSGKSSLLQALTYAKTDYLKKSIKDYIRWGCDSFYIYDEFEHLGINYKLEITGSKTATKKLTIDDKESFFNSDATKELAKIIDPKLTLYSNIATQLKNITVIEDKPSDRLDKLKIIFGMEKITASVELSKDKIKSLKDSGKVIEQEVSFLSGKSFNLMPEIQLVDLDKIKIEFDSLCRDKQLYESMLEKYNLYKIDKQHYDSFIKNFDKVKLEIDKKQIELKSLKPTRSMDFNSDEYKSIEIELYELGRDFLTYQQYQRDLNDYKKKHTDVLHRLDAAKNGVCYACGQPHIESLENVQLEFDSLITPVEIVFDMVYKNTLDKKFLELKEQKKTYDFQEKERELYSIKKSSLESVIISLQEQLESIEDVKNPIEIIMTPYDSQKYDKLNREIIIYEQKENELVKIKDHNSNILQEKEINNTLISSKKLEIENLNYQIGVLTESQKFLDKKFSSFLIEQGAGFVEDKMNEYFHKSYGDKYEIHILLKGNSVEFLYKGKQGILTDLDLAGGQEQMTYAIAFRVAISQLQNLSFLILDEIDSSADIDTILDESNAVRMYKEIFNLGLDQVIFVSHNPDVIDMVREMPSAKIYELEEGNLK